MTEFIYGYDSEYERFNENHKKGTIYQSYIWSKVKPAWHWVGIKVRENGALKGIMGILIRPIPFTGYKLMYAPRGPVWDVDDTATLAQLTSAAEKIAKKEHAYVLKVDTDIEYENAAFRRNMQSLGYRLLPQSVDFDNIQAQFVARLYLTGKSQQQVLDTFKKKTRYNIRLAQRRGVQVREQGVQGLDEFYPIMRTTGIRDGFIIRSYDYFKTMLNALGEHARLYMAYYEGEAIAGAICTNYGNKTWYQYGASSNEHRDKMPNYLLQWHMIQWAINNGSDIYDFRGVSGNMDPNSPHYGLWRFKSGFGTELVKFAGEFEYVYHPLVDKFMDSYIPAGKKLSCKLSSLKERIK